MAGEPTGPDQVKQLLQRAEYLLGVRRAKEAYPLVCQALTLAPDDSEANCYLARVNLAQGQLADALAGARYAASLDPENEWPHRLIAITLQRLGRPHEAVFAAWEAVRRSPDGRHALYTLADTALDVPDLTRARQAADRLLVVAPDWPNTHFLQGHIANQLGYLAAAEEHLRRGLSLDPERSELHQELGLVLERQGRSEDAVDAYYSAARENPEAQHSRKRMNLQIAAWTVPALLQGMLVRALLAIIAATIVLAFASPIVRIEVWIVPVTLFLWGGISVPLLRRWLAGRKKVRPEALRMYEQQRRRELHSTITGIVSIGGAFVCPFWALRIGALLFDRQQHLSLLEALAFLAVTGGVIAVALPSIRRFDWKPWQTAVRNIIGL